MKAIVNIAWAVVCVVRVSSAASAVTLNELLRRMIEGVTVPQSTSTRPLAMCFKPGASQAGDRLSQ